MTDIQKIDALQAEVERLKAAIEQLRWTIQKAASALDEVNAVMRASLPCAAEMIDTLKDHHG